MNHDSLMSQSMIDKLCINTIRTLSIDAIQKANSGHPGAPMGLAPAAYVLWTKFLNHNPKDPDWPDRDRFVLSGGHASMLLYSLLHLTGYDISLDDLKNFRQLESKTPGHPEYGLTPGVETTTGPLGQGIANAVGMAMAESFLGARFNRPGKKIVNHYTYVMCGDGDMMEGISSEAASLAGHLGLSKLICLYDDNKISIEGPTDITFTEDVAARFEAYGWDIQRVEDGNTDFKAIAEAIEKAKTTDKPSLIILRTFIAYGSPGKENTSDAHGAPLGEEEVRLTKEKLGCPSDKSFCVVDPVLDTFKKSINEGSEKQAKWQEVFNDYASQYPDMAKEWDNLMNNRLPDAWDSDIPNFSIDTPIATRAASGQVLNAIAANFPTLIGGSADLAPSNKTFLNDFNVFQKGQYKGRNIRFGVREHAMAAIMSGMALHKVRPYGGTFLVFADYMRPSIRMASLMKLPVIYVFTHDSIAVGEDGPTHQPVEHLASLRAIPGLTVIRPSDATETAEAWREAIKTTDRPTALLMSRQKFPVIDRKKYGLASGLSKGAYILSDSENKPDILLIATGSEVSLAMSAQKILAEKGVAACVISMPSWELFEKQSQEYKDKVLLPEVNARLIIEAGISMGWERYAGFNSDFICMKSFGASASGNALMEKFGFTTENVVKKALTLIS
ncbi:transketolase 1 [Candidatus Magnetomoraceae bacterium gMMP-15]